MTNHPATPQVQAAIIQAMNTVGETLVGSTWQPIVECPVPQQDLDAMLQDIIPVIPAPQWPAKLESCQHHRIDNETACCKACSEEMIGYETKVKTVLSAPNINPCNNPEHLAAIRAGKPVECDVQYVPGIPETVVVGYEVTYQCSRCDSPSNLIEDTVFVPDCGHSHRGDMIRPGGHK